MFHTDVWAYIPQYFALPWSLGGHLMANDEFLLRARDLRARAQEVLAKAETVQDAEARRIMLEIAERYIKLAERLEQAAS
jgi:hemerythrin-like domain-containing protein